MSVYGSDINMDKCQTINVGKWQGFLPLDKNKTHARLILVIDQLNAQILVL
jgi:hypothetical protein